MNVNKYINVYIVHLMSICLTTNNVETKTDKCGSTSVEGSQLNHIGKPTQATTIFQLTLILYFLSPLM